MKEFMDHDLIVEKIVLCCYVAPGKGATHHKDRPSHGIAINLGGTKKYVFNDGKTFYTKTNDVIYLPKGSTYDVSIPESENGACFAINFDISEQISFEPFVRHVKNAANMTSSFKEATRIWSFKDRGFNMRCIELLYRILNQLQQEYHSAYIQKNKADIISPAIKYIHENYCESSLRVSHLAEMCNISSEYFRRIFHNFYGTSPIKYINDLKLTRAKELIASGLYSVTESAELSGYNDMAYFSREFKKKFSVSPSEYKK